MLKRIFAAAVAALLVAMGIQTPAHATGYDFAVTASAVANTTTVPSVITWTVNVESVGDAMGQFGVQEGTVTFTAPASISLVLSDDCDTTGNAVTCYWSVTDEDDASFEVHGLVSLLAAGNITVTPTFSANSPREDVNAANDSDPVTCTAVTSLLVTC